MHPTRTWTPPSIVFPPDASCFNFKPGIIQLLPTFHGFKSQNPYLHLREFEEVYDTCIDQNYNMNIIKLKFFPFSIKEKAKTCLQNLNQDRSELGMKQAQFFEKNFSTPQNKSFQKTNHHIHSKAMRNPLPILG